MKYYRQLLSSLLTALFLSSTAQAGKLNITVKGIKNDEGTLNVGVWDDKNDFPEVTKVLLGGSFPLTPPMQKITINDLKPGKYAIAVFHDENRNGEIDTNFLTMPTEYYGFSNNARGGFGPPKFEKTLIEVGNGTKNIEITIKVRND